MTPALADRDSLDIFFFPLRPDILPRFSSQLADRVVSWHLHNTGAAPRAPGARWPSARQSRPQVRPACRRCWAGPCLSWGCICACQWRQAAVLRAADSSGGRRRREESRARRRERHHTRHKMAGEAAASPAVRRSAAARGLAAALGALPRRPGGLWESGEAAAGARRPRAMWELAAGAPGEAGPTTPVAPLRQRRCWCRARPGGGFAPRAGGCGGRPVLDTRGRASRWRQGPRFDPVT